MLTLFRPSANALLAVSHDPLHILLRLSAGNHDLVPAPAALQTEVRADTQDLPLLRAAGMLLLQF